LCVVSGQIAAKALAAASIRSVRATESAGALGIGRLGSIIGAPGRRRAGRRKMQRGDGLDGGGAGYRVVRG